MIIDLFVYIFIYLSLSINIPIYLSIYTVYMCVSICLLLLFIFQYPEIFKPFLNSVKLIGQEIPSLTDLGLKELPNNHQRTAFPFQGGETSGSLSFPLDRIIK